MKKTIKKMLGITAAAALTLSMGSMALIGCGDKGTNYTFEAEDAILGGSAVVEEKHTWAGADKLGEGDDVTIVGYLGVPGNSVTWKINAASACEATLTFTAASIVPGDNTQNGAQWGEGGSLTWIVKEIDTSKNKVFKVSVNDSDVALKGTLPGLNEPITFKSEADFAKIGYLYDNGFNNHSTCTAKVNLKEGENIIVLTIVTQGINLDKLTVTSPVELTFEKTDNSDKVPPSYGG